MQLNAQIDTEVYNAFFSACKLNGSTVTAVLQTYMEDYAFKVQKKDPDRFKARKELDAQRKTVKK